MYPLRGALAGVSVDIAVKNECHMTLKLTVGLRQSYYYNLLL